MAGLLRFSSSCAITGASEGLGAVVALHLAKAGAKKLILGARRMEKLLKVKEDVVKQSPSVDVILVKLDVRDAESRANFVREARENSCNVLVNNAGVDRNAFFEKMSDDEVDLVMETNLLSCVKLTRSFLNMMLEAKGGHIVNMCSVASQLPVPFGAIYATSKAGLLGFSASLRAEMIYEKKPVTVHSICPGLVVDAGMASDREERLGLTIREAGRLVGWTTPKRVAEAVIMAIEYDEPDLIVNCIPVRVVFGFMCFFPRLAENTMLLSFLKGTIVDRVVRYFRKDAEFEASQK
ncbi:unnamed protein product [Durusdinium trenchii]|uniref:Ketoacyl reductase HetN n=2 Tax=Durusdinium trenchii TaxID=1381693 RepID=A0ABP0PB47_9DINO